MNLQGALTVVQQRTYLTSQESLVFNFFISADDSYLHKAKAAIRKLYRETYSGIKGVVKSYIIPYTELIKFLIKMTPTVVKVLLVILPLVLQRKINKCD